MAVNGEFMKYKPRWNSIPTYEEFDFEASLDYKPLEYYTSLSPEEYDKLDPKLKSNIEFTKYCVKRGIYGLYAYGYMKDKLTWKDHLHNFYVGQIFNWVIMPVTGWLTISFAIHYILELLGF